MSRLNGMLNRRLSGQTLFIATLTMLLATAARADYSNAAQAYDAKDYATAFTELKSLAELGHTRSQYSLGAMYLRGEAVAQNIALAYGWTKLAADGGNPNAIELEARMRSSLNAEVVKQATNALSDFSATAIERRLLPKLVKKRADLDKHFPRATLRMPPKVPHRLQDKDLDGFVLTEFYVATDGTVRDVNIVDALPKGVFDTIVSNAVLKWRFEVPTRDGKPEGMWVIHPVNLIDPSALGHLSVDNAKGTLKALAESGEPNAQFQYALVLAGYPDPTEPFLKPFKLWHEVLPWIVRAAQGGSPAAQYLVAQSLLHGYGCELDKAKGLLWLQRSVQQNYVDAQVEMARIALHVGADYDATKASYWLEKAVAADHPKAKKYLAALLAGSPDEKLRNPARALQLIDAVIGESSHDILSQEIKAVALANVGQFDAAVTLQTATMTAAQKNKWNVSDMEARLTAYRSGKPWYGDVLEF